MTEGNQATPGPLGPRYLASIYTLSPTCRPEMHKVVCILLMKALVWDGELRAFIEQHIETATVPRFHGADAVVHTMNFAIPTSTQPLPMLCQQLLDYCSRPAATRFQEPLVDGAGNTVGFLSLTEGEWQHTHDVALSLVERMRVEMAVE